MCLYVYRSRRGRKFEGFCRRIFSAVHHPHVFAANTNSNGFKIIIKRSKKIISYTFARPGAVRHRSRQSRANRRRRCCCNGDSDDGDESPWEWKAESNNKRRIYEWKIENFLIKSICISNIRVLNKELNLRLQYIVWNRLDFSK